MIRDSGLTILTDSTLPLLNLIFPEESVQIAEAALVLEDLWQPRTPDPTCIRIEDTFAQYRAENRYFINADRMLEIAKVVGAPWVQPQMQL